MAESLAGAAGRQARKRVARRALGGWEAPANRADPVAILEEQAATRVPELVPIRYARMAAGRFPFLRGAPAIMAADLAATPDTGLTVQLCGDAHLSNFGLFASPERALVFDLNDFDETLPGPFEWDVKRLAASIAVAARANGFADTDAETSVGAAASAYRATMGRLAGLGELAVWYEMIDADKLAALAQKSKRRKGVEQALADARARTNLQALEKLTEPDADGVPRIRHRPPLLTPIEQVDADTVRRVFADFRRTLAEERRVLLDRHEMLDVAVKVVGVGSVGTRCFVALLAGRESRSPLFLQVKEAQESVLARHTAPSKFRNQGHRVVHGQRLTQAASDIFLGWAAGSDGRHYYCRQLRDMKGSATIEEMSRRYLRDYSALCGHTLARAHARSGDRVAIAAYLGTSDAFDRAMIDFALAYADQTAADHQTLLAAIESGRIVAADRAY
ncbi:hypothetical protein NBRGN_110_00050 [Nocardia brasiliensis NBRC 14402]|uniref:DUF2252 domain-containing protein n=1 Tax=Nocardia brasiliensis TaxID=37326 RepID=UPI00030A94B0|nr:DUF2252 domain-containing protein [Nocardia brasiliensis]ASF09670.1 DUF2252 domain-containing protein [Nocardia brasiliensis]GAJ86343.1 hypothetical protein NBRGN_110_00050 [Nocardia brasiliensis NBRC 14402]SUB55296.1 Uncharacterized protein conserved in bacteria [Nocardia brasiliensis]